MKSKQEKAVSTKAPLVRKVLLVDDHPIMRQGLTQLINSESDIEVVAEAQSAEEAMHKVVMAKPDIVITDITLPGRNGLELIKDLQALEPALPILTLSMHDESLYVERVLRAGARGYVMKQEGGKKLIEAIRGVLDGQISISAKMSARMLESFSGSKSLTSLSPVELLSDRQFEVFQLIGQGLGTRQIAEQLNLSIKTIEVHRGHIKEKMKITTAPELVRYAVRWLETDGAPEA
ncbi:response regulator transcription factor [Verrucomicrobia bacterium]|nr:response regulator transcription factor [Verrucomicrobiota bacterium]